MNMGPGRPADYGRQFLRCLCRHSGRALMAEISAEIALDPSRLSAMVAGLAHNGYVIRENLSGRLEVVLTESGRRWAASQGIAVVGEEGRGASPVTSPPVKVPPVTSPPVKVPPVTLPPVKALPIKALPVTVAVQKPRSNNTLRLSSMSGISPEQLSVPLAVVETPPSQPEVVVEMQQPTEVPLSDEVVLTTPPDEKVPRRSQRKPSVRAEKTRSRSEQKDKDITTDANGFVTHIGGKRLF